MTYCHILSCHFVTVPRRHYDTVSCCQVVTVTFCHVIAVLPYSPNVILPRYRVFIIIRCRAVKWHSGTVIMSFYLLVLSLPYSHNAKKKCYRVVTIMTRCLILMLTRCRSHITTLTRCRVIMLSGWHIVTMSCCHGVVLPQSEQGSSLETIVFTEYITYWRAAKVNKKIIHDTNYARH